MKILQTTDPHVYYELFEVTSSINRAFCHAKGIAYTAFVGQRVGVAPWHATFNRIPLLEDVIRDGYRGWLLYLDADAYIADVNFDMDAFLKRHAEFSIIAAPGGVEPWNINAGVLFLNLQAEFARFVVAKWALQFEVQVGHERLLNAERPWQDGIKNDQVLLHEVLMKEQLDKDLLVLPLEQIGGTTSKVVRQILREKGNMRERCEYVRKDASHILALAAE
jgi:hypothetical protein